MKGTSESEILRLVGRPDDVRTQNDPGGFKTNATKVIWCYGTNGHLTFPTLGCVYIQHDGTAQYVYGGQGDPPAAGLFDERQLRELLRLIDRVPGFAGDQYNPLPVIQIVNRLQPLGKEKALAAIDEYLRVASDNSDARDGLFLVLRALFDVPKSPGHMPHMLVGMPSPQAPKDPAMIPRFPIVLLEDVPLLLVWGYTLFGEAEPVAKHVQYFREQGRLRANPLSPTNAPLKVFGLFHKDFLSVYGDDPNSRECVNAKLLVINQLLRLVDSVYRVETDVYGRKFSARTNIEPSWSRIVNDFGKLDIRWDEAKKRYTFKDGSSLPDLPRLLYTRETWKLDGVPGEALVIVERIDRRHFRIELRWSGTKGTVIQQATVKVYNIMDRNAPLAEISLSRLATNARQYSGHVESRLVQLNEGDQVQLELASEKGTSRSSIYKP
jgi:hypothetical protein